MAVLLGLIAVVSISTVSALGIRISDVTNSVSAQIAEARGVVTAGGSPSAGGGPAPFTVDAPAHCEGGSQTVDGGTLGTTGNDSYEIDGTVSGNVNLDSGDDLLSVCAGADTVDFGPGSDTVWIVGTMGGVDFGDGPGVLRVKGTVDGRIDSSNDDTTDKTVLVENDVTDEIDLGDSDDSVTIGGNALANVNLQGGVDDLDVRGSVAGQINADQGGGGTTVKVAGSVAQTINLTDADDTVEVGGNTADVNLKAGANALDVSGSINGNLDADDSSLGTSATVAGDITGSTDLSDGNDTLTVGGDTGAINTEKGGDTVSVTGKVTGLIDHDDDGDGIDLTVGAGVDGRLDLSHGDDTVEITGDVIYTGTDGAPAINSEQGSDSVTVSGSVLGGRIDVDDDANGAVYNIGGDVDGDIDLSNKDDTITIGGNMTGGSLNTEAGFDRVTIAGNADTRIEADDTGTGLELKVMGDLSGSVDDTTDSADRFIVGGRLLVTTFNAESGSDSIWLKGYSQSDWTNDADGIRTLLESNVENVKVGGTVVQGDASAFDHSFFD